MDISDWRYAFTSVRGTSHFKTNSPCQDAGDCQVMQSTSEEHILVAAVSDGAGSAERAQDGSALACSLIMAEVSTLLEAGRDISDITKEFCAGWLTRFQNEVAQRADANGLPPRAYACTLLVAVISAEVAVFFQIGDGAIVILPRDAPDDYSWIFWPEKGEYENQTYFATDAQAIDHLQYTVETHPVYEVALFSDGLQRLALHMESQTAYSPFFSPMFASLRSLPVGHSENLSVALEQFLSSKRIQDQTDDDSTLILATRLVIPRPASE